MTDTIEKPVTKLLASLIYNDESCQKYFGRNADEVELREIKEWKDSWENPSSVVVTIDALESAFEKIANDNQDDLLIGNKLVLICRNVGINDIAVMSETFRDDDVNKIRIKFFEHDDLVVFNLSSGV